MKVLEISRPDFLIRTLRDTIIIFIKFLITADISLWAIKTNVLSYALNVQPADSRPLIKSVYYTRNVLVNLITVYKSSNFAC